MEESAELAGASRATVVVVVVVMLPHAVSLAGILSNTRWAAMVMMHARWLGAHANGSDNVDDARTAATHRRPGHGPSASRAAVVVVVMAVVARRCHGRGQRVPQARAIVVRARMARHGGCQRSRRWWRMKGGRRR
jgi:hypothetical protein